MGTAYRDNGFEVFGCEESRMIGWWLEWQMGSRERLVCSACKWGESGAPLFADGNNLVRQRSMNQIREKEGVLEAMGGWHTG